MTKDAPSHFRATGLPAEPHYSDYTHKELLIHYLRSRPPDRAAHVWRATNSGTPKNPQDAPRCSKMLQYAPTCSNMQTDFNIAKSATEMVGTQAPRKMAKGTL
ncbi:hypothetical protein E6O75_ATG09592 [Venturia nashicola]|uniref:Uncharacterized protein n=1 Tax=Venturia nashicola TaxID=86259 RepID=A0A4Z1P4S8_9PEZI|nr:hypothetical protein E6O75_ATG09592 [Venturia nashicola]